MAKLGATNEGPGPEMLPRASSLSGCPVGKLQPEVTTHPWRAGAVTSPPETLPALEGHSM